MLSDDWLWFDVILSDFIYACDGELPEQGATDRGPIGLFIISGVIDEGRTIFTLPVDRSSIQSHRRLGSGKLKITPTAQLIFQAYLC